MKDKSILFLNPQQSYSNNWCNVALINIHFSGPILTLSRYALVIFILFKSKVTWSGAFRQRDWTRLCKREELALHFNGKLKSENKSCLLHRNKVGLSLSSGAFLSQCGPAQKKGRYQHPGRQAQTSCVWRLTDSRGRKQHRAVANRRGLTS